MDEKVLKISDVAEMFGVTTQSIRRYILQGLPYHTLPSGSKRFIKSEVLEWVKEGKKDSA